MSLAAHRAFIRICFKRYDCRNQSMLCAQINSSANLKRPWWIKPALCCLIELHNALLHNVTNVCGRRSAWWQTSIAGARPAVGTTRNRAIKATELAVFRL
eukprot:290016-Pleurochrysis_carterae.AAC.16